MKNPGKRISIGKADRETAIGLELLGLCQSITADGSVSDDELAALQGWLDANRQVEMVAIGFLRATVQQIILDGIITEDERKELYLAIEKVLPPDLRQYAVDKRKQVAAQAKEILAVQKLEAKEAARNVGIRDASVYDFDFMLAGVAHESRGETVRVFAREGMPAFFARDRSNRHSPNAVAVFLQKGGMIGWVREGNGEAEAIAALLDAGFKARLTVKRILRKTRNGYSIPVIAGSIHRPESSISGALSQSETEQLEIERSPARASGCLASTLVLVIILLGFALVGAA